MADLFGEESVNDVFDGLENSSELVISGQELQSPRSMNWSLGHEDVESGLIGLFQGKNCPHALIFSGARGIGKATTAYRFSKYILSQQTYAQMLDTDINDPVVRRIVSGGHPDFMTVERAYDPLKNTYKDSVSVSDIRKIPQFLRMTAAEGGWRIVIIDDADTMNRNAQNALLKSLEEPPAKTLLILIAHRLGSFLPTIRSRAQVIPFQPLSEQHIQTLLQKYEGAIPEGAFQNLVKLARGSIGRALEVWEKGGLDTLEHIQDILKSRPNYNWPGIHTFADSIAGRGREKDFSIFEDMFIHVLEDSVMEKVQNIALPDSRFHDLSLVRMLEICDNAKVRFEKVRAANLDPVQAVLQSFANIAHAGEI